VNPSPRVCYPVPRLSLVLICIVTLATIARPRQSSSGETASFTKSQQLLQSGNLNGALEATRSVLRSMPRSVEGLNLLGIIYDQQKQYAEAQAAFEQALAIDPRSTITHNNLGNNFLLAGKADLAEREFRATLRLNPSDPATNYNLGALLVEKDASAAAIKYLEGVQPRDPSTSLKLIEAYLGAKAVAKGLTLAERLSAAAKDDPRIHFTLGVTLASKKQYTAAIHELELAGNLMPGTFEILHNLGQAYLRAGNDGMAVDTLTRALAQQPDSVPTMYLLAQAEAEQHKYPEALELLTHARELDPSSAEILFLMAQISMVHGMYGNAIPLLEEGIKVAPRQPDLYASLGESYLRIGKSEQAIKTLQALIKLDPSAASYAFMGITYERLGRFDEARKVLTQGLAKDLRNAACLYTLGFIAQKQSEDIQAERLLTAALRSDPGFGDALYALATLKMRQGNYADAIPLLRRYITAAPDSARAYYKLSVAERNLQQTAAASGDLNTFEALSKNKGSDRPQVQQFFSSSNLSVSGKRMRINIAALDHQIDSHGDNPQYLCLLTEICLGGGDIESARKVMDRLRQINDADSRAALTVGTLLSKYHFYPEAIQQFQKVLTANPSSDDAKYDLAFAYFQAQDYPNAAATLARLSAEGQRDDSYLALSGEILAHSERTADAIPLFRRAVEKNPDNDQYIVLLVLAQAEAGQTAAAAATLQTGLTHTAESGLLSWGRGILSAIEGRNLEAERGFAHALDLLPDWRGSYSVPALFYCATGQASKAQAMMERLGTLSADTSTDVQSLRREIANSAPENLKEAPLSKEAGLKLLHFAIDAAGQL
jgi:tetratricopeptide (TPR) repeat protein